MAHRGMSNTIASLPGVFGVGIVGFILERTNSWRLIFLLAVGVECAGTVLYILLGSAEVLF